MGFANNFINFKKVFFIFNNIKIKIFFFFEITIKSLQILLGIYFK